MNVLFFSGAHPDDIELWCGELPRFIQNRDTTFSFVWRPTVMSAPRRYLPAARYEEAKNAAAVIGEKLIWLDFKDEFLIDSREIRLAFIDALRQAAPDVVFCHWRNDYNPDRSISGRLVDECIHIPGVANIKTPTPPVEKFPHVYYMDTPAGVGFEPELYVDITSIFETKLKLVAQDASQSGWMKNINKLRN